MRYYYVTVRYQWKTRNFEGKPLGGRNVEASVVSLCQKSHPTLRQTGGGNTEEKL